MHCLMAVSGRFLQGLKAFVIQHVTELVVWRQPVLRPYGDGLLADLLGQFVEACCLPTPR